MYNFLRGRRWRICIGSATLSMHLPLAQSRQANYKTPAPPPRAPSLPTRRAIGQQPYDGPSFEHMLHPRFLGWCFFQRCSTKAPCPSIYGPRKSAINPENSAITIDRKRWPRKFCHQPREICHHHWSKTLAKENLPSTNEILPTIPIKFCHRPREFCHHHPRNSDQWIPAIGPENSAITITGKRWPREICHQPRKLCHQHFWHH